MFSRGLLRHGYPIHRLYDRFETAISSIVIGFVSIIIVYSVIMVGVTLFQDLQVGIYLHEATAMKDTFGLILTVLILIEFNHSIVLAMRRHTGVLQVRVVVLITVIVIARKLILLDYAKTSMQTLLGLGGLALALGALYWILSDVDHRRSRRGEEPAEAGVPGERIGGQR